MAARPKFADCLEYSISHSTDVCVNMHPPCSECSVYSIIMDQASGTGATLELGEGEL